MKWLLTESFLGLSSDLLPPVSARTFCCDAIHHWFRNTWYHHRGKSFFRHSRGETETLIAVNKSPFSTVLSFGRFWGLDCALDLLGAAPSSLFLFAWLNASSSLRLQLRCAPGGAFLHNDPTWMWILHLLQFPEYPSDIDFIGCLVAAIYFQSPVLDLTLPGHRDWTLRLASSSAPCGALVYSRCSVTIWMNEWMNEWKPLSLCTVPL